MLLPQEEWYSTYVNPYELLWLMDEEELEALQPKDIQKAKKKLLQEIELEDGVVEWMPGLKIDRSRAIKVADELMDERLAGFQRTVAQNRELCSFLSRGDIGFFLVDPQGSPIELLDAFDDEDSGFARWLGERFAPQYDLVLTKALESRSLPTIEALLSGRRMVLPQHEDRCFEGAQRQVSRMLEPLKAAGKRWEKSKPTAAAIKALLEKDNLGKIVSLLPQYFQQVQNDLAGMIRGISIGAHNNHHDTDLAREILEVGKGLAARSPALLSQIQEDEKTLNKLLAELSEHDATVHFRGQDYSITRKTVAFGSQKIPVQDVRKMRFGIVGKRDANGPALEFNMDIVSKDDARLSLAWTAYKDLEKQEELFKGLQEAAFNYLLPPIMENLKSELDRGHLVKIGPAMCNEQGVRFNIEGWFNSKQIVCPWSRVKASLEKGRLVVSDPAERKARHELSLASTDNAIALYFLINAHQN